MMTRAVPLLAIVAAALAGCTGGQGPASLSQAPDTAVARFIPGGEVTVVQVTVSDRRPVRNAELVGPDGTLILAYSIDLNRATLAGAPQYQAPIGMAGTFGFGSGWSSSGWSSSAIGLTVPLGGSFGTPGNFAAVSDQIQSTALIRLTDPQDYKRTWQDWKVRIQLGDPPEVSFITLQAPQPPA